MSFFVSHFPLTRWEVMGPWRRARDARRSPRRKCPSTCWRDVLAYYFDHPYTNAILEGLNSVIQNVKTRARGFRTMGYFSTMIYLTCGKLDLKTVTA